MKKPCEWAILAAALAIAPLLAGAAEGGKSAGAAKPANAKQIERGRYMVQTGHCNNCHTAGYTRKEGQVPEAEWLLGNPVGYRGPWGTTYATNLRLSVPNIPEGDWIKYAKAMKPRPPMPWWALRDTTDADLRAMYQYIRHLGPAGAVAKSFVPPDKEPAPPYESRQVVQ